MKTELALVIDKEFRRIICSTTEPHQAVLLAEGLINCSAQYIVLDDSENYDFNDINNHYRQGTNGKVIPLGTAQTPDNWAETRTQVIDRLWALQVLDYRAKLRTATINNYYNTPMFTAILVAELEKCKPEENIYSPAIEEWAMLQDVSAETAYKELKIKYQDVSMTYMRNNAIYLKYARKIIQTTGKDNLMNIVNEIVNGYERNAL